MAEDIIKSGQMQTGVGLGPVNDAELNKASESEWPPAEIAGKTKDWFACGGLATQRGDKVWSCVKCGAEFARGSSKPREAKTSPVPVLQPMCLKRNWQRLRVRQK
jgi:ribosomal protein L37AE/L43A